MVLTCHPHGPPQAEYVGSTFGPTHLHPGLICSHLCLHLKNLFIPGETPVFLHIYFLYHCVLWASHDHVCEAWVLVGPREGQEAGPFLQCCLCLPQPHHLQSPEQGCKKGLSESAWPQRDSSITQGVSELPRIMGRLDGPHKVSLKYIILTKLNLSMSMRYAERARPLIH